MAGTAAAATAIPATARAARTRAVLALAVIRRVTSGQPAGPLPYFNMT
ncbi:hypothetical protein ACF1E9_06630 [Streptomyces roseolus]